ncbi:hypothetical protein Tsubulata_028342 [Turnera subulata]|uniref:Replication factor A C-terminal domain-containing protein n=1 Tax=Turnera subulata TaxID=218843 RepID=A0A9Q0GJB4_9ROSI|nr:hypothetical protein Tsubulata_028342 [Turnera subulata]
MLENRKSASELLEMEDAGNDEIGDREIRVTLNGRIKEVHNHSGWCYFACPACWKKIDREDPAKICSSCTSKWNIPDFRYKVEILAADHTGELTLTLFDREVERLIHMSAFELKYGWQYLAVSKILLPDEIENEQESLAQQIVQLSDDVDDVGKTVIEVPNSANQNIRKSEQELKLCNNAAVIEQGRDCKKKQKVLMDA